MLNVIAMLTFLALDGHLLVLAALVRSFDTLPIAQIQLHQNGWAWWSNGARPSSCPACCWRCR